jgi:hypothetical protein
LFEDPMPAPARNGLLGIVFVAVILLLVEWRIVH